MTIEEKREKLDAYCDTRYCIAGECDLYSNDFICGDGMWLGGAGDMPDNEIEKAYELVFVGSQPTIKDSGDRTMFSTGAVRDMHTGKGRMDLLPWRAIIEVSQHCEDGAIKYGEHNVDLGIPAHSLIDSALRHLAKFIIGMKDENHLRAAAWNILWALEMRSTHPELMDIPWRPKHEQEEK